jgi:hypothetical protein
VAVRVTLRDALGFKHKRPGFKKPIAEGFSGWELRKTVGDLVRKLRLIDRENDHYQERVETEQGEVIHQVDHPLSEHRGHGSDKPELKKDKKESQRPT